MLRTVPLVLFASCLSLLMSACGPAPAGTGSVTEIAPISGTASVGTASVGTALPVQVTELPPETTPPPTPESPTATPLPTLPGGLGPTELKYRILQQFPDLFFCDPDYYPIARADELDLARQRFPELRDNVEEFDTILAHNNLSGFSTFTDDQKLLIYREHKKLAAIQFDLAGSAYRFQMQSAKTEGEGELISGQIDGQGTVTVEERNPTIATCPICLAAGTRIETPGGSVPVEDLRPGMEVWTVNAAGERSMQPILRVGKTLVPETHRVVHLVLEDGRESWVSPGHPLPDGRKAGMLQSGNYLDGSQVLSAELIPYSGTATYDILPAGETGFYWANGMLLASTLCK